MDCPNCIEPLRVEAYRANPYRVCWHCEGVWVHQDALSVLAIPTPALQVQRESKMTCPECNEMLWPSTVGEVELECCKNCQAIWFDRDELERVANRYRSETDWNAVGQDLKSAYSFFQAVVALFRTVSQIARKKAIIQPQVVFLSL